MKRIPEPLNILRSDLQSPTWAGYLSQRERVEDRTGQAGQQTGVTPTLLDLGTSLPWVWIERELAEVPASGQDTLYV